MKAETKEKIIEYAKSIVIAGILAIIIRTFIVQPFKIPSESMLNTLKIGDHLFVIEFIYGTHIPFSDKIILPLADPQRGDIIVFKFPMDTSKDYIKRCIAVPGDKLQIINKKVYVNDMVIEEPYIVHGEDSVLPADVSTRDNYGPKIIPRNQFFMMGDNRDGSYDSRFWGFLDRKYILGKAVLIYWPLWRVKFIK